MVAWLKMMYQTKEFTGATHTDVAIWVSICVVGWVSWLFATVTHNSSG